MAPDELDELESGLDPTARFIVAYLRQENAKLREQLKENAEHLANVTEQLEDGQMIEVDGSNGIVLVQKT